MIRLVTAIGIGYATERIHTALHDVPLKVCAEVQFLIADFGRGNDEHRKCPASLPAEGTQAGKSAVLSLFLSLHKQRKENMHHTGATVSRK